MQINTLPSVDLKNKINIPILQTISSLLEEHQIQAFVIGGFVRDIFLDKTSKDIDIVVLGSGIDLAEKTHQKLGKKGEINIFKNFGTAMIRHDEWEIEFVGARKESYTKDSRKPTVENGSMADDQNRRDFTINALAINLHPAHFGELTDPFNGLQHLEERLIKTPLDPNITYSDDPLRMMRAIRFATQLGFDIHPESLDAITTNAERIRIISKERIADELNKIILSPQPSIGFKLLFNTRLLHLIFPQMVRLQGVDIVDGRQHKDNFYHTLKVLDNIAQKTDYLWLRWAAILHDIAKPLTKRYDKSLGWTFHGHEFLGTKEVFTIFKELKLPQNEKMKYVSKLVGLHHRPIILSEEEVTDSAIRRLLFDAGDDIEDLITLCEADITSKNKEKVERYLRNFSLVKQKLRDIEEKDKLRNWQPPITGELIMETFQIAPCKEVGLIKNAIREAILDGEIPNEYDQAYALMLKKAEEYGIKK